MSDEGERGARWTEMTEEMATTEDRTGPTPSGKDGGADQGRPPRSSELPEIKVPEPTGRTEFSELPGAMTGLEDDADGTDSQGGAAADEQMVAADRERPVRYDERDERGERDERDERGERGEHGEEVRPRANPWFERPARFAASETGPPQEEPREGFREESGGRPAASSAPAGETEEAEEGEETAAAPIRGKGASTGAAEPGDVRVAPAVSADDAERRERPAEEGPAGWEGSLFDGAGDQGEGVSNYAPVEMPGANAPVKPGRPSSGNWRLPDWINDEDQQAGEGRGADSASLEEGRSRVGLYVGVGLLLIALVAAGGVVFFKRGGSGSEPAPADSGRSAPPAPEPAGAPADHRVELPPDRAMPRFQGEPSRRVGMVVDRISGLSWPRFGPPWQLPTKQNRLGVKGWSGQQVVVTERRGNRIWYGQLLTGGLQPALVPQYTGPDSLKQVTALALDDLLKRYYGFPHTTHPVASQALTVGGRQGWLIGTRLSYRRPGVRATGELVAVAVIDTGRRTPALVFASMPNTHRKLYPDITAFFTGLRPVKPATE